MVSVWFHSGVPVASPECGAWQYVQDPGRAPVIGDLLPGERSCMPMTSPVICASSGIPASTSNAKPEAMRASLRASLGRLGQAVILEHLHPVVVGIHHEDAIVCDR